MIKLNVGCGSKKIHGYLNIDTRPDCNPDKIMDISKISSEFKDVDVIYACHVLEHLPPNRNLGIASLYDVLNDWYVSLKYGGILRIAVPDAEAAMKYYLMHGDLAILSGFFHGGMKHINDIHYTTWDFTKLKECLQIKGFKDIRRYDWRTTEHNYIDDYSQSYLPHMDKNNGILMSLNVEATK
jgi:predicted SAM-dependent methyltransferase